METLESRALDALEQTTGQTADTLAILLGVIGGDEKVAIEQIIWYFHALRSLEDYLAAYENFEI